MSIWNVRLDAVHSLRRCEKRAHSEGKSTTWRLNTRCWNRSLSANTAWSAFVSLAALKKGLSYQDLLQIARTGHIDCDVMMNSLMRCFEASARNHPLSGTFMTTMLKSKSQSLSTKMQVATEHIKEQETEERKDEVVTLEQVKLCKNGSVMIGWPQTLESRRRTQSD